MKNALPPSRATGLYNHTAEACCNTDSVVYYDITFSKEKQGNHKFERLPVPAQLQPSVLKIADWTWPLFFEITRSALPGAGLGSTASRVFFLHCCQRC